MNNNENDLTYPDNNSRLPTPKKNGWIYIFVSIAALAVVALILTTIFRDIPRRNGLVKKRSSPVEYGVYTAILSPVDSATARAFVEHLAQRIGKDSAVTKMVVGGTHMFKQCSSFDDYREVVFESLIQANPKNLRTQSLLLAQVADITIKDQAPSTLYLVGTLASKDYTSIENNFDATIAALQLRNQTIGPLYIYSWLINSTPPDSSEAATHELFLNSFRKRGFDVTQRPAMQ